MDAMQRGDVDAVVVDARRGRRLVDAAAGDLVRRPRGDRAASSRCGPLSGAVPLAHRLAARANGQAAVGAYTWDEDESAYLPFALDVLTLDGERIKEVTAFITRPSQESDDREKFARWPDQAVDPGKVVSVFERFGLPARLD